MPRQAGRHSLRYPRKYLKQLPRSAAELDLFSTLKDMEDELSRYLEARELPMPELEGAPRIESELPTLEPGAEPQAIQSELSEVPTEPVQVQPAQLYEVDSEVRAQAPDVESFEFARIGDTASVEVPEQPPIASGELAEAPEAAHIESGLAEVEWPRLDTQAPEVEIPEAVRVGAAEIEEFTPAAIRSELEPIEGTPLRVESTLPEELEYFRDRGSELVSLDDIGRVRGATLDELEQPEFVRTGHTDMGEPPEHVRATAPEIEDLYASTKIPSPELEPVELAKISVSQDVESLEPTRLGTLLKSRQAVPGGRWPVKSVGSLL